MQRLAGRRRAEKARRRPRMGDAAASSTDEAVASPDKVDRPGTDPSCIYVLHRANGLENTKGAGDRSCRSPPRLRLASPTLARQGGCIRAAYVLACTANLGSGEGPRKSRRPDPPTVIPLTASTEQSHPILETALRAERKEREAGIARAGRRSRPRAAGRAAAAVIR